MLQASWNTSVGQKKMPDLYIKNNQNIKITTNKQYHGTEIKDL